MLAIGQELVKIGSCFAMYAKFKRDGRVVFSPNGLNIKAGWSIFSKLDNVVARS